jgi:hypothetical protein
MHAIRDLDTLLARLQPELNPGRYVFVTLPVDFALDPARIVATIREPEGMSAILPEHIAESCGLPVAFVAAWITLAVHSDLAAVGLTAAVSCALWQAGISCNVVAGARHDHLFVPVDQARPAMDVLRALSRASA